MEGRQVSRFVPAAFGNPELTAGQARDRLERAVFASFKRRDGDVKFHFGPCPIGFEERVVVQTQAVGGRSECGQALR